MDGLTEFLSSADCNRIVVGVETEAVLSSWTRSRILVSTFQSVETKTRIENVISKKLDHFINVKIYLVFIGTIEIIKSV